MNALLFFTTTVCIAFLFGSVNAACPTFMKHEKACTCLSYMDGSVVKCKGPNAPEVIEKLKAEEVNIRELVIEDADIVEIGPQAFRNLKIRSLNMDNNQIEKIHQDAFAGLENSLVSLSLAHNKLSEVPTDSLSGMNSLLVLNLKCNNIGNMYTTVLQNVPRLIELNLACNRICKISGSAFEHIKANLQSLILDNNCLKDIPAEALRNFNNLLALHLQNNHIENIEKLQLMNMVSLLIVRLSYNKIRNIDRYGFNNIPNLRYLFLDHNQLNVIEPNVLQQFQHLEIADLSYNDLAEITSGAFHKLEHLLQLNLEGNSIRDIAPGAFAQTPLLLLLLGSNCLTGISQQMFQGTPFLRQLSLANNNIKNIQPFAFIPLANLQLLDLSNNKLDAVFPASLAPNFGATVIISENPVVCGSAGYHVLQGGKPIMLVNEPNVVCARRNQTTMDTCPTRKMQIPQPPCCSSKHATPGHSDKVVVDTLDKLMQMKSVQVPKLTNVSKASDIVPKARVHTTKTLDRVSQELIDDDDLEMKSSKETAFTETPTTQSTTTITTTSVKPDSKHRTPNMHRFWKLTRPPPKVTTKHTTTRLPNIVQTANAARKISLHRSEDTEKAVSTEKQRKVLPGEGRSRPEITPRRKVLVFNEADSTARLPQTGSERVKTLPKNQRRPPFEPRPPIAHPNPQIVPMSANFLAPQAPVHDPEAHSFSGHQPIVSLPFSEVRQQFPIPQRSQHGNEVVPKISQRPKPFPQDNQFQPLPETITRTKNIHRVSEEKATTMPHQPSQTPPNFDNANEQVPTAIRKPVGQSAPAGPISKSDATKSQSRLTTMDREDEAQPPGIFPSFMNPEASSFGNERQNSWEQIPFEEPFLALHFSPVAENAPRDNVKNAAGPPGFLQKSKQ